MLVKPEKIQLLIYGLLVVRNYIRNEMKIHSSKLSLRRNSLDPACGKYPE